MRAVNCRMQEAVSFYSYTYCRMPGPDSLSGTRPPGNAEEIGDEGETAGMERKNRMTKLLAVLGIICILYCLIILIAGIYGSFFFLIWGVLGICLLAAARFLYIGGWQLLPVPVRAVIGLAAVVGLLIFLITESLMISRFGSSGEPDLDYIIVLGAQMWENGPSKALRLRLDTALKYLEHNEHTQVIVSGGKGSNEPVSEAQGMYVYLTEHGGDPDRIIREERSVNTCENLRFSRKLMEEREAEKGQTGRTQKPAYSVGIVTSNFHVYRSLGIAQAQGYARVCGIAAPSDYLMQPNNMLREFMGIMKDLLTGNMRPPK